MVPHENVCANNYNEHRRCENRGEGMLDVLCTAMGVEHLPGEGVFDDRAELYVMHEPGQIDVLDDVRGLRIEVVHGDVMVKLEGNVHIAGFA